MINKCNRVKKALAVATASFFVLMSCANKGGAASDPDSIPADSLAPVETKDPDTKYSPAFAGQTRIAGVKTTARYTAKVLTGSLKNPWGVKSLPNGKLLITEKSGQMRIVSTSGNISEPISGVPEVNAAGQGGLLGLCLDPDFATNRMVYWSFSEPGNLTAIAKGKLSEDERVLEGVSVIYRATPAYSGALHYGGRVVFDREGNLIVSTGERSDMATRPQAQFLNSGLGKIIRISKNGQPAAGNPFSGQAGARPELYAFGVRNPQGLAIHPETGDIWESEHGPRGGDEINRIRAGVNYGWPTITYGIEYSGGKVGEGIQQKNGMEQPVYYWDPVVSPSGITFYTGDRIAEWKNNLFISCLSGMHIIRLVINNNRVTGEERLLTNERERFRDITQGGDGALYAITDGGKLYKIDKE